MEKHPGLGVMIQALGGYGDTAKVINCSLGKKIKSISLGADDALRFEFEDGTMIKLFDNGQSCCESRYMRTDDNLEEFIGATLVEIGVADAPDVEDDGEEHNVQFLNITTSIGVFTMSSHVEHNGYYGGFAIEAEYE